MREPELNNGNRQQPMKESNGMKIRNIVNTWPSETWQRAGELINQAMQEKMAIMTISPVVPCIAKKQLRFLRSMASQQASVVNSPTWTHPKTWMGKLAHHEARQPTKVMEEDQCYSCTQCPNDGNPQEEALQHEEDIQKHLQQMGSHAKSCELEPLARTMWPMGRWWSIGSEMMQWGDVYGSMEAGRTAKELNADNQPAIKRCDEETSKTRGSQVLAKELKANDQPTTKGCGKTSMTRDSQARTKKLNVDDQPTAKRGGEETYTTRINQACSQGARRWRSTVSERMQWGDVQ